jgi:hypothetical protein
MRTQVTFILRLWIDPEAEPPSWEGQVECIADGERTHVRGREELARFVEAHAVSAGTRCRQGMVKEGDHL